MRSLRLHRHDTPPQFKNDNLHSVTNKKQDNCLVRYVVFPQYITPKNIKPKQNQKQKRTETNKQIPTKQNPPKQYPNN